VAGVQSGSPAAGAGMVPGDVITGLNGTTIASADALTQAMTGRHPGESVTVNWVAPDGSGHHAVLRLIAGPVR